MLPSRVRMKTKRVPRTEEKSRKGVEDYEYFLIDVKVVIR
jgi:hypothetical protein